MRIESETMPGNETADSNAPKMEFRGPEVGDTLHIQYSGKIDLSLPVEVYNLDLIDTDPSAIRQLHDRGIFVMCYFSAGSFEKWRMDAAEYPQEILGKELEGWPGERWLDIRQTETLLPIIEARLDTAVQKGCDGVDPDNVNGYENDTGFPLGYEDQITFNTLLAETAHERGLSIGLKNDLGQIPELLPHFDWIINEECFFYDECNVLSLFIEAGKPVFVIEYELAPSSFCQQAMELKFFTVQKNWELDSFQAPCPQHE